MAKLPFSPIGVFSNSMPALSPDRRHRPLADTNVTDLQIVRGEFIYLTDKQVLSNAWAGRFLWDHHVSGARLLAAGEDDEVLVVGSGRAVRFHGSEPVQDWQVEAAEIKQAAFDAKRKRYLLLADDRLWCLESDKTAHRSSQARTLLAWRSPAMAARSWSARPTASCGWIRIRSSRSRTS